MQIEGTPVHSGEVAHLWKEAMGGDARWNAIPDRTLSLRDPYVQVSVMAYWIAEQACKNEPDPKTGLDELKKIWSADVPDSPSTQFRSYLEQHGDETVNPHNEIQIATLLKHIFGRPTVH